MRKQYSDMGVIFLSDVNRRHMLKVLEDNNLEFHSVSRAAPTPFCRWSIRWPSGRA